MISEAVLVQQAVLSSAQGVKRDARAQFTKTIKRLSVSTYHRLAGKR